MKNDPNFMTPLTRAEINEIERRKREQNDARMKALWGCGATARAFPRTPPHLTESQTDAD